MQTENPSFHRENRAKAANNTLALIQTNHAAYRDLLFQHNTQNNSTNIKVYRKSGSYLAFSHPFKIEKARLPGKTPRHAVKNACLRISTRCLRVNSLTLIRKFSKPILRSLKRYFVLKSIHIVDQLRLHALTFIMNYTNLTIQVSETEPLLFKHQDGQKLGKSFQFSCVKHYLCK